MHSDVAAVVTAAGSGTRFGGRKQFARLATGERLVDRAVETVRAHAGWVGLVLPADSSWTGPGVDAVVAGGASRLESLAAGLAVVPPTAEIVIVHGPSHPLASMELAGRVIEAVRDGAAGAVPFLATADVIKRRDAAGRVTTVGREGLGAAQIPMAFRRSVLVAAFAASAGELPPEESQLLEATGVTVVAVDGELTNVHVVDRDGLDVADLLSGPQAS